MKKIFDFFLVLFLISLIECKNYYDILGVSKTDTTAQIKKAFRNLALKYHPDKNPDKDAESKFREIVEAYEVLSDPDKRKAYDQTGRSDNFGHFESNSNQDFNYEEFFRGFDEAMKNHHKAHDEHHRRAHQEHMRAHRESLKNQGFMFDFDDLFSDFETDFFGSNMFGSSGSELGDSFFQEINTNQNGMNCKTIKKKQGNTVITHTECH